MDHSSKSCKLYVLLTRTGTSMSRLISIATKAELTHSSIGIDPTLSEFYSFGRYHPRFILPGGFIKESLSRGVYGNCPHAPCMLLETEVSPLQYQLALERIDYFKAHKARYDVPGVFYSYYGKERNHPTNYVCSRFVAETLALSGAIVPTKPVSLYRPVDFLAHKEFRCVYSGTISDLDREITSGRFFKKGCAVSAHTV